MLGRFATCPYLSIFVFEKIVKSHERKRRLTCFKGKVKKTLHCWKLSKNFKEVLIGKSKNWINRGSSFNGAQNEASSGQISGKIFGQVRCLSNPPKNRVLMSMTDS